MEARWRLIFDWAYCSRIAMAFGSLNLRVFDHSCSSESTLPTRMTECPHYRIRSYTLLKRKHVVNSPEMRARADGAFVPFISPELFFSALGIVQEQNRRFSNEELI